MGSNPIEAATNNKEIMKYDRFNLEEEIQNVWHTKNDLDAIAERVYDDPDGPMTEDQIGNLLIGLSELHETRCKKLFLVFETMVKEECFVEKTISEKTIMGYTNGLAKNKEIVAAGTYVESKITSEGELLDE